MPELYPVETLQDWRRAQAARGGGYALSEAEVVKVKAFSFTDLSTNVTGEQVMFNLGGQGGSAPGAGGGGGGAMGGNALGGPGGAAALPTISPPHLDLDGQAGMSFGAGGGGGGAVAPGSVPDMTDADLTGYGFWDGSFDGQPGGDTTFGDPDSAVFLVAKGGRGSATDRLTDARFTVSSLTVAQFATTQNDLMTIVNGAAQSWTVLNVGDACVLNIAAVFEATGVPVGAYTVHFDVRSPGGTETRLGSLPLRVARRGRVVRIPVTLVASFAVTVFGRWTLSTSSDTSRLAAFDLAIRQAGTTS